MNFQKGLDQIYTKLLLIFDDSAEIEISFPFCRSFSTFWNITSSLCAKIFNSWIKGDLKQLQVTRYENSISNHSQNYDQGLPDLIISTISQLSFFFFLQFNNSLIQSLNLENQRQSNYLSVGFFRCITQSQKYNDTQRFKSS